MINYQKYFDTAIVNILILQAKLIKYFLKCTRKIDKRHK